MATPLTLGESLAHVPRGTRWMLAVLYQIHIPIASTLSVSIYISGGSPSSFFGSVPWRLALLLSWSAYLSLLLLIKSYAELFLPRTPVAVDKKIVNEGLLGVGVGVIGLMVAAALASRVEDNRVLASCTGVVAAFIAGLVAFWVWLARTYGGSDDDAALELESSGVPPAADEPGSAAG
ncbi:hypothetical protein C2845_PM10G00020 [Panicum miliaceum]|uniref:DUF7378 domain-containing protein n=1 Tax=Panicum miliaceum TaxID=4540 RepID=A0A3L6PEU9_PANMI|nr:hypothetical protein C2845_PM10G00020 [Panicum miliaceum]